jgi:hypothetical protein
MHGMAPYVAKFVAHYKYNATDLCNILTPGKKGTAERRKT